MELKLNQPTRVDKSKRLNHENFKWVELKHQIQIYNWQMKLFDAVIKNCVVITAYYIFSLLTFVERFLLSFIVNKEIQRHKK